MRHKRKSEEHKWGSAGRVDVLDSVLDSVLEQRLINFGRLGAARPSLAVRFMDRNT